MEDNVIHMDIKKEIYSTKGKITLKIRGNIRIGEMVALYGSSGAGKTTLLRMLSGLISPDWGRIQFGQEVWFDSERKISLLPQQRSIGFMFQEYALFPNMTVKENIRYASSKQNSDNVDSLIQSFGLTEFANRKPMYLSGGQKQRVALARALAREPSLLLLDEPLSALDSELRRTLQEVILKAHLQFKPTTILVSHDLSEVFRMADSVICIENGEITAQGSPMQVFSNNNISGKVQITGEIVDINPQDTFYILTIITGINQIIKVIAFENDLRSIHNGDKVMVFTKAFNPMIMKI